MDELFDHFERRLVFKKAARIPSYDERVWRRDRWGIAIRFEDFGKPESPNGWEFEYVTSRALGGTDDVSNLRPVHFRKVAAA